MNEVWILAVLVVFVRALVFSLCVLLVELYFFETACAYHDFYRFFRCTLLLHGSDSDLDTPGFCSHFCGVETVLKPSISVGVLADIKTVVATKWLPPP